MTAFFDKIEDARTLAQIVVDTVRDPLLVLDGQLKIMFASGSFLRAFALSESETQDQELFALDNGAWNIPALRMLLERIIPDQTAMEGFEVTHEFPRIGLRNLLLNARKMVDANNAPKLILLAFEDVTSRRVIEQEKERLQRQTDELLLQKEMLLAEMQHRIVNSLQIIASILMLKAKAVTSVETREHLKDAHRRVMSIAAVQQHLHRSGIDDLIEIAPYLSKLCTSLAESMIGEDNPATIEVTADEGRVLSSSAVSIGLIVTELVINALKYAFPPKKAGKVTVGYQVNGTDWNLSVSDDGVGRPETGAAPTKGGLGTSLVNALAQQLDAKVKIVSSSEGMRVSISHATFSVRPPLAA